MHTIWHLLCSLPIAGVHHAHYIALIMYITLQWSGSLSCIDYSHTLHWWYVITFCLSCSLPCIDPVNYLALITLITLDRTRLLPCIDHAHYLGWITSITLHWSCSCRRQASCPVRWAWPWGCRAPPPRPVPGSPLCTQKLYIAKLLQQEMQMTTLYQNFSITKAISQDPFRKEERSEICSFPADGSNSIDNLSLFSVRKDLHVFFNAWQ